MLQKSEEVQKSEFNDISRQLEILVCSLKRSGAWEIRKVDEYRCGKGSWITDQPKNTEEKKLKKASPLTLMF